MVELNVSHLKITTQTHCNCERSSFQTSHSQNPWKKRTGAWWDKCTDGPFIYKVLRITLPRVHQNSLFAVGYLPLSFPTCSDAFLLRAPSWNMCNTNNLLSVVMNEPVCRGWWKKSTEVLRGCTSRNMRVEQAERVKLLYMENNH